MRIHSREGFGDVLVFLTGQAEIEKACKILREAAARIETDEYVRGASSVVATSHVPSLIARSYEGIRLLVLPLYGALPSDQQAKVFLPTPEGYRKVVIATNIAETSLTVDGVRYVVDPGLVKQKEYNAERGMESLGVVSISKVGAAQRAGRAGRTGPGKCYRLYNKEAFAEMADETEPEIKRTNLANVVLYLKVLGIVDVLGFEFLDPPPETAIRDALKQLFFLGAITEDGVVTPLGRRMAEYPLEPKLSRMLIMSYHLGVEVRRCVRGTVVGATMTHTTAHLYRRTSTKSARCCRWSEFSTTRHSGEEVGCCVGARSVEGDTSLTQRVLMDTLRGGGRPTSRQGEGSTRSVL